jgi:nucleoid DNA-binding protein
LLSGGFLGILAEKKEKRHFEMTIATPPPPEDTEHASEETEQQAAKAKSLANMVKKKEIYDHVTVATGLRKREVREAIDATLAFMFETLSAGKDVHCPPLGKIRVISKGEGENAKVMYRLNIQKPGRGKLQAPPEDNEADAAEE